MTEDLTPTGPDDEGTAVVDEDGPPLPERTAYFGRFDPFEAEIVVELLKGAGVFAVLKHEPTDNEHFTYSPILESDRGVVLVDAARIAEARALVDAELPQHLESIEFEMEAIDVGEAAREDDDEE